MHLKENDGDFICEPVSYLASFVCHVQEDDNQSMYAKPNPVK